MTQISDVLQLPFKQRDLQLQDLGSLPIPESIDAVKSQDSLTTYTAGTDYKITTEGVPATAESSDDSYTFPSGLKATLAPGDTINVQGFASSSLNGNKTVDSVTGLKVFVTDSLTVDESAEEVTVTKDSLPVVGRLTGGIRRVTSGSIAKGDRVRVTYTVQDIYAEFTTEANAIAWINSISGATSIAETLDTDQETIVHYNGEHDPTGATGFVQLHTTQTAYDAGFLRSVKNEDGDDLLDQALINAVAASAEWSESLKDDGLAVNVSSLYLGSPRNLHRSQIDRLSYLLASLGEMASDEHSIVPFELTTNSLRSTIIINESDIYTPGTDWEVYNSSAGATQKTCRIKPGSTAYKTNSNAVSFDDTDNSINMDSGTFDVTPSPGDEIYVFGQNDEVSGDSPNLLQQKGEPFIVDTATSTKITCDSTTPVTTETAGRRISLWAEPPIIKGTRIVIAGDAKTYFVVAWRQTPSAARIEIDVSDGFAITYAADASITATAETKLARITRELVEAVEVIDNGEAEYVRDVHQEDTFAGARAVER